MVQVSLARGWDLDVERGPDCLFVRPRPIEAPSRGAASLSEQIWALLEQSLMHRLVLELDEIGPLDDELIDQMAWLQSRILGHGGMMRLCCLSSDNRDLLKQHEETYESSFHCYQNREEAMMGHPRPGEARPSQPR